MNRKVADFAIYRGDEFLFLGSSKECTEYLGCSYQTFRFYLTPSYEKRIAERKNAKNHIVVIKLDDEDE